MKPGYKALTLHRAWASILFTCLLIRKSCQKLGKKQSGLRNFALKRKKGFKETQKQEVAQKRRKETRAVEVTFVSEDDVVSEQILPLAESASKRKIQRNDDESFSNEGIEDCFNGQSS